MKDPNQPVRYIQIWQKINGKDVITNDIKRVKYATETIALLLKQGIEFHVTYQERAE